MRKRPACPLPEPGSPISRAEGPILDPEEARREAASCLFLQACQGCEVCELICPDQAITRHPETGRPEVDLTFCKGCGLCAHFCPKGAIRMVLEMD